MNFLRIVKFDIRNIVKNPMLLIINTIFPLVIVVMIGYLTSGSYRAGAITSYDYYGVTMMIYTALMVSMTVSNTFMEKTVTNGNLRIVYAPVSKTEIYLSKIISTYLFTTVTYSILMCLMQFGFHINFGGENLFFIIVIVNIFTFFSCCFGTMLCCLLKSEESTNTIVQPINQLLAFFGGLFFPVASLGKFMEEVSNFMPTKWITECTFRVIYDYDFSLYLSTIGLLILGSAVCIAVSQITFKPEEYV